MRRIRELRARLDIAIACTSLLLTAAVAAPAAAIAGDLIFADDFESADLRFWGEDPAPPGFAACADGTHLVHRTGVLGIVDPDTFDLARVSSPEYSCVPDEECGANTCGPFGTCRQEAGVAACACDPGYAGESCERCAAGYEGDNGVCVLGGECRERVCSGQGACVDDGATSIGCVCDAGASGEWCEQGGPTGGGLRPPTRIVVAGADGAVEMGGDRLLKATLHGDGAVDDRLIWTLHAGPGLLLQTRGHEVTYRAPAPGGKGKGGLQTARLRITAECCPDHFVPVDLTIIEPDDIGVTGVSKALMQPLDQAILDFMRQRCVGAATLGVNLYGERIYTRGFGNLSGAPSSDPSYLAACGDTFDVSDEVAGYTLPEPAPVLPTTPMRIGSNTKAVTAAILRKEVKEHIASLTGGPPPTDSQLEATLLTDPSLGLLPGQLGAVLRGDEPPPLPLASLSGKPVDCSADDPCPYGGVCVQPEGGGGVCTNCPAGRSGVDCSILLSACPDLSQQADARWSEVTLGRVLGHRAGLPRSVPDIHAVSYPNLGLLRGLDSSVDWLLQEAVLTNDSGFPAGDFADEFPDYDNMSVLYPDSIFVPRIKAEESILARAGACLAYPPGHPGGLDTYSNTDYSLLGLVAEHTTGQSYSGKTGKPDLHTGSLLHDFLAEDLGLVGAFPESAGLIHSQNTFRLRDPREPIYRWWNSNDAGYYGLTTDTKRPHCVDTGDGNCSFAGWIGNPSTQRLEWDFGYDVSGTGLRRVPRGYSGGEHESASATGSLAATPAAYLEFMSRFWVGGDGNNPHYGETRCPGGSCIWNEKRAHNGKRSGTLSWVVQLGGGSATLELPPVFNGRVLDAPQALESYECDLPAGVDVFVAINTTSDKKCTEAMDYDCDIAYGLLYEYILFGVCQVQWPANPFQVWPPELAVPTTEPEPGLAVP